MQQQTGPSFFPASSSFLQDNLSHRPPAVSAQVWGRHERQSAAIIFRSFPLFLFFLSRGRRHRFATILRRELCQGCKQNATSEAAARGDLRSLIRHRLGGCLRWLFTNDYTKCFHSSLITECEKAVASLASPWGILRLSAACCWSANDNKQLQKTSIFSSAAVCPKILLCALMRQQKTTVVVISLPFRCNFCVYI